MTVTPILQAGQIEAAAGDIPELRLPSAKVFSHRANRFRQLAEGHSLGDYLRFLADLADGQQRALDQHPAILAPDAHLLASCREHAMPPLGTAGWRRHPHWLEVTGTLAEEMYPKVPAEGRKTFVLLLAPPKDWLEAQADQLLARTFANLNLATAPLIWAALQVQWTYQARQLDTYQATRHEQPALCPVCGSHPVASIIRTDGPAKGLRYLHCALCSSEWHVVRSKCSNCDTTKGVSYYSIEGGADIVRAEACPVCHSYLKVIHQEKDPQVDPVADDLATLALDLLMGENTFVNNGINFFMLHGNGAS